MGTLDLSTAVDRVRLTIADYNDPEILPDDTITYVLTKNSNNETAAAKECAIYILGALSHSGHQRLDRIEIWGSDRFNQYLTYLKQYINSPTSALNPVGFYVAGVDKQDVVDNILDSSVIQTRLPITNFWPESDGDSEFYESDPEDRF